jgi:hypothetical protein
VDGAGKAIDHAPQTAVQIDPDAAIPGLTWGHDTLFGTQPALHVRHAIGLSLGRLTGPSISDKAIVEIPFATVNP